YLHTYAATNPSSLSLHDALPICISKQYVYTPILRIRFTNPIRTASQVKYGIAQILYCLNVFTFFSFHTKLYKHICSLMTFRTKRSEEQTSELQSRENRVCRLLLE